MYFLSSIRAKQPYRKKLVNSKISYLLFCLFGIMPRNPLMDAPTYDPNRLFDTVIGMLGLKSDLALSRVLCLSAPNLCHMRHRNISVGPSVLVRMHEETGMSVAALRGLMGDRRARFRSWPLPENERRKISTSRSQD